MLITIVIFSDISHNCAAAARMDDCQQQGVRLRRWTEAY